MIENKIKSRREITEICRRLKGEGKTIGFTSGAFDLLHAGHVDYLERAKALCDVLVVGVNSDISIKKYKGDERPVVKESHRMRVIAGLESVDYVFLFDERRNKKNIELLKPDFYIKAGDYKPSELTSKEIVEKYDGEVHILPIQETISTSDVIAVIKEIRGEDEERFVEKEKTVHIRKRSTKQIPAVFLDRDGTVIEDVGYLHDPEKVKFLPGALEGIKKLYDMGYRIIIVTNQPGIGIGYFPEEDFYRVNRAMLSVFSGAGILVDKIYFCPHSKSETCSCRKPGQTLIERAKEELNLNMHQSFFIGDKTSDMETGRRAGMQTILVRTGFGGQDGEYSGEPDFWAEDLLVASEIILKTERE